MRQVVSHSLQIPISSKPFSILFHFHNYRSARSEGPTANGQVREAGTLHVSIH